jgi:DNA-binding NarL/FixJ family response regulator
VILDLHMPDMNGFDVASALARTHAAIPVIVVAGFDTSEARSSAQRLGVSDYLLKPVDGDSLLAAIDAAIMERQ